MKKQLLFLACCGLPFGLYAQEATPAEAAAPARVREVGLAAHARFARGQDTNLLFRFGNERAVWRAMGGFSVNNYSSSDYRDYNLSLAAGREYRHTVNHWLELRGGGELTFRRNDARYTVVGLPSAPLPDPVEYRIHGTQIGARLVGGVNFLVGSRLVLGLEALPGIAHSWSRQGSSDGNATFPSTQTRTTILNFTRPPLFLSAAYRF